MAEWVDFNELIDRIQDLIDLGLVDDARKLIDEFEPLHAGTWEMPFLRARIYMEQNKPHSAIPHLREAQRLDPRNPDCLLGLFYAYSQIGRLPAAARYLFRAYRYHPDSDIVLAALIWYYTETNRLTEAREAFEKARALSSSNPEVYRNGGLALQKLGEYDMAESCFRTALELNPNYDEVRDILTDQYLGNGDFEAAIAEYREYLKSSPKNVRALSRLVFCLSQAERYDEAQEVARQIIENYPNSTVGYVDLSYVHLNQDDPERALELADKAVAVAPEDAEAHRARAIALSDLEQDADANAAFEKALSLDPRNAEIMRDFYNHLHAAGDFERMEKMIHRVIRMEEPYCLEDYWFLADHLREQGQDARAFQYLHKAYRAMPGEPDLLPPMASILLDRGHVRYALPFLLSYVQRSGWDERMNEFARHRRLRGARVQEAVRFLRYLGEHPVDFRHHLLAANVRKYVIYATIGLYPFVGAAVFLALRLFGLIFVTAFFGAFIAAVHFADRIPWQSLPFFRKKELEEAPQQDGEAQGQAGATGTN